MKLINCTLLKDKTATKSIFFKSHEDTILSRFCYDEVKAILDYLHTIFKAIQKEFPKYVRDLIHVFDSMESNLDETLIQNEILRDRFLEATLTQDVEKCVLMCSDSMNDNLNNEIEKVKRESIDVQENFVRRPPSRSSSSKNSVLPNTKNQSEVIKVHVRTNKKTNVTSRKNIVKTKKIVANVDVKTTLKATGDVLCVSCDKNVLTLCHDKCLAQYKLFVNSKVRRALFTTPRTTKSKSLDTTPVVAKTRFAVVTPLSAKNKDSSALQSTSLFAKENTLSNYMRTKVKTKVVLRSKTCYVYNMEGDDLLTGDRESNLYTISISDMAASSPVCLMSKATSTKSWLWHQRLSHLNFGTINHLTKQDLVDGLLKFKYDNDHLCFACEQGKRKKATLQPKLVPSTHYKLELIHMDLCRPMSVESINGNKYILVIVDDYSGYTWVYFLRTKDEALEMIKKFIAQVQLNFKVQIQKVKTDNGTEFKNATLQSHYEKLGIMKQFSIARTPQQNGVVERRNRTLVEAARTMLIFSKAPEFLWAKAISTACFT
ncbi:retrovirus-related pol polyprotein from transposon TNT 1-94 [Tanacetum coccineum]